MALFAENLPINLCLLVISFGPAVCHKFAHTTMGWRKERLAGLKRKSKVVGSNVLVPVCDRYLISTATQ
jgi:hypothetical protein